MPLKNSRCYASAHQSTSLIPENTINNIAINIPNNIPNNISINPEHDLYQ